VQVRKHNVLLLIGALSFVAVLVSGCLKSVDNTPQRPKAFVSVMHLAPRAPSVDIFFNDTKASNAAFPSGGYSSYYSPVDPGFFSINFKKGGGDSLVASLSANQYDSLKFYTILLYNTTTPDNRVQAVGIHDDYRDLSDLKSLYRFFHMSPDIGEVDVYFNNEVWESGRQYADNVFGSSFYNQFQQKTANSYNIVVKKAGSDSVIAQTNASFATYQAYTIFLKGMIGGSGANELGVKVLQAATQ
jgi:hypothetical protein